MFNLIRCRLIPTSNTSNVTLDRAVLLFNRYLILHAWAPLPKWVVPLFNLICWRLIPTAYTSKVTLDRVVLLFAIIKKIEVDAGHLTHNQILVVVKPSKGIWFLALIKKFCKNVGSREKKELNLGCLFQQKCLLNHKYSVELSQQWQN